MKQNVYIASIAFTALLFAACEKTEFNELMDGDALQEEARNSDASFDATERRGTNAKWVPVETEEPTTPGVVKEVSDGDDESDDDDTSNS